METKPIIYLTPFCSRCKDWRVEEKTIGCFAEDPMLCSHFRKTIGKDEVKEQNNEESERS